MMIEKLIDSLKNVWTPEFKEFTVNYYLGDLRKYNLIPGGYYLTNGSGEKVSFDSFLLFPYELDDSFFKAFNIIFNRNIITPTFDKKADEKIKSWLGMSFITKEQIEYLIVDGWRSEKEKNYYNQNLNNYNTNISEFSLTMPFNSIKDKNELNYFLKEVENKKRKIERDIKIEKENAYRTGKAVEINKLCLMPGLYGSFS